MCSDAFMPFNFYCRQQLQISILFSAQHGAWHFIPNCTQINTDKAIMKCSHAFLLCSS
uniref:Uncharacterized protein n=1 Tax=Anguilla anguilla TaxID=7936 RepID=A0A0E9RXE9_ANGAN